MSERHRFALILAAGILLQAVIVPFISLGRVQPDIILVIVAVAGFVGGPGMGAVGGFAGGLVQDLLAPGSMGLNVLIKTLVGYFSGQVERTILGRSVLMPFFAIGVVSFTAQTLFVLAAFLFGEGMRLMPVYRFIIAPSALYTAIIGFIIVPRLSLLLSEDRHKTVFK